MENVRETVLSEIAFEAVDPPVARHLGHLELSPRLLAAVSELGRLAVVWLPLFLVLSERIAAPWATLGGATAGAVAFSAAHKGALGSIRLVRSAVGPTATEIAGVGAGIAAVAVVDSWAAQVGLPLRDLGFFAVIGFVLAPGWDRLVSASAPTQRVLVVGAAHGGSELIEDLAVAETAEFEVVGVVDDRPGLEAVAGAPVLGGLAALPQIVRAERPDIVVLPARRRRTRAFGHLLEAADVGFRVVEMPEFYEQAFGRVPVRTVSAAWFMSVLHLYRRPYARATKRAFDVVVASLALVLTAPLWPVVALLVRCTGGPVLYRQTRLGEAGRPFTICKFRTMRADAEANGVVWASESDPRVTRIGAFLRRSRLDELPQLLTVLRGDMSIVGPRPERPEFLELLREAVPFWTHRHLVKPGITGWAQVCRGYTADVEGTAEKLSYDLWYLRHRSLLVDLAICARTARTLLNGFGAR